MTVRRQVVLVWVALTAAIVWGELLYDARPQLAPTVAVSALFSAAGTTIILAALYALDSIVGRVLGKAVHKP
jgi:hypothetical protein